MKACNHIRLLVCVFFFAGIGSSAHAQYYFKAYLNGQNETYPVQTLAHGEITARLSGQRFEVWGSFSGLSGDIITALNGGMHIHLGMAGQNGGIRLPLRVTVDPDRRGGRLEVSKNTFTLTIQQMDELLKRRYYINVHTTTHQTGEIRGQLLPLAEEYYHANLFGSNEVPAVMTSGFGSLDLEVKGNKMTVSGSFQNLDGVFDPNIAGGVHIHTGYAGQNGGISIVLRPIIGSGGRSGYFPGAENTFTLNDVQLLALRERRLYVNIHTNRYPGGEIRGQIVGQSRTVFRAHLAGANEVAPIVSNANGVVLIEVVDPNTILCSGSFSGLESDLAGHILGGAHIHNGLAGTNGPIDFSLGMNVAANNRSATFPVASNHFTLNANQMNNLFTRTMYVNVHSTNFTGGEIRGQLLPEGPMFFTCLLSGAHEVTPVSSPARGAIKVELTGNKLVVSGSFSGLSSEFDAEIDKGMHLHFGYAGQRGSIEYLLTPSLSFDGKSARIEAANNTFVITDPHVAVLRNRQYYINVHSIGHTTGEIRGQVLFEAQSYHFATLSGSSESNPVNTPGNGMVAVEITGDRAVLSGSFQNLSSGFNANIGGGAHLHKGIAGRSGGIELPLNTTVAPDMRSGVFAAANNNFSLSGDQINLLRERMLYVNVHTQSYPGGEIRGQLLPAATTNFTANLSSLNLSDPILLPGNGNLKFELSGDRLIVSGSFNGLSSDYDANSPGGGASLLVGPPTSDGPVVIRLNPTVDPDRRGGFFAAANNNFLLDPTIHTLLRSGDLYVNISSVNYPAGELRGQILPEINFFPTITRITSPVNGAEITIDGSPSTPFQVNWTNATDNNFLYYIWQLSVTPDFSNVIYQTDISDTTVFLTDYATMDDLLELAGVPVGGNITLYHRAVSSDGSLWTPGNSAFMSVSRGNLTVVKPPRETFRQLLQNEPANIRITSAYPNPAVNSLFLEFESDTEQQAMLQVFDLQGRLVENIRMTVYPGSNHRQLESVAWKEGIYFLRIAGNAASQSTQPLWKVIKSTGN